MYTSQSEATRQSLEAWLSAALRPAQWIGHYRLVRTVGAGTGGTVFLARDHSARRSVAVALKWHAARAVRQRHGMARALREATLGNRITHINLISPHKVFVGRLSGATGLATISRYVHGASLRKMIKCGCEWTEPALKWIADEVLKGLSALHLMQVVHLDIKPSNILWGHDNRIRLVDFGLSQRTAARKGALRPYRAGGSFPYAAPEQLHSHASVDGRADLFSLGATLFDLITGHSRDTSNQVASNRMTRRGNSRLRQFPPGISTAFIRWIERCCMPDADRRFATADDARNALGSTNLIPLHAMHFRADGKMQPCVNATNREGADHVHAVLDSLSASDLELLCTASGIGNEFSTFELAKEAGLPLGVVTARLLQIARTTDTVKWHERGCTFVSPEVRIALLKHTPPSTDKLSMQM